MSVRVGVNGFGRIGRNFFRAARKRGADIEFVAVNDLGDAKTMAHLLKYDSVLGPFDDDVEAVDGGIRAGDVELSLLNEKDPAALPWKDLGVEVVLESTGLFTKRDDAQKHLDAGAEKVRSQRNWAIPTPLAAVSRSNPTTTPVYRSSLFTSSSSEGLDDGEDDVGRLQGAY